MSQDNPKNPSPERAGGFGFNPRPRRRPRPIPADGRTTEELVAEFLKTNTIKQCDARHADGAVKSSGAYEF